MILTIPQVLSRADVSRVLDLLRHAPAGEGWIDGTATSGKQSAPVKNNQQMPEQGQVTAQAREIVLQGISRHPLFMSAALPRRMYPPNFNRYAQGQNYFGEHIDNAMRAIPGHAGFVRTDLSCTLFLTEPDSYTGGELVIKGSGNDAGFKLSAGDLLLYPATTVHHIAPVTEGERIASFFWVESMVRSLEQRQTLYELDMALMALRTREIQSLGQESPEAVRLTGTYHNLLRMWASP